MFPLHDNDGRGLGFLVGLEPFACPPQAFQYQHAVLCAQAVSAVIMLGSQLGSVHEHAQRVEHRAVTDSLTGVYNRTGWMSRLARLDDTASLPGHDIGILMLDLDYLKVINDNQGHAAGDDLLCRTARAIQSVVRHEDYVGRLGGDEFGVLVSGATPQVLDALMQRMAAVMAKAGIGISMGMALRSEADSLKHVMHLADQRMYDHKRTKPEPVGLEAARKKRALAAGAVPDTMARGSESR
jgi:diguanylate cyclase (GGDEF)-like protein